MHVIILTQQTIITTTHSNRHCNKGFELFQSSNNGSWLLLAPALTSCDENNCTVSSRYFTSSEHPSCGIVHASRKPQQLQPTDQFPPSVKPR